MMDLVLPPVYVTELFFAYSSLQKSEISRSKYEFLRSFGTNDVTSTTKTHRKKKSANSSSSASPHKKMPTMAKFGSILRITKKFLAASKAIIKLTYVLIVDLNLRKHLEPQS